MDVRLHHAGVELDARRFLTLDDALGTRIDCIDGEIWITQDGDTADYFVDGGRSFTIDVQGKVVIQAAQRPARIVLHDAATPPRRDWLGAWLGVARIDAAPPLIVRTHGA
jgi:hypothetical protein